MADSRRPTEPPLEGGEPLFEESEPDTPRDSAADLERLRELLLGKEQEDLGELQKRFDDWQLTPEELAEQLPEAIGLRTSQDESLGRALAPTLEDGISESVQRNPQQIAQAIYPILGPAIRRAISDTLAGFVETLNRAIEHSFSWRGLKWRFEALRTGAPYAEIVLKHALVYRVEEVFLIEGESGLPLGHVALDDARTEDPDLVSGMLTAIQDFVADSFETTRAGGLRRFKVGELTVRIESGPEATLAAVIRGQEPPELVADMQSALETIHLQFRTQLKEFDGDTAALEPAEPILAELLETVVATDRAQARSWAPHVAWWLVGAVVLALAVFGVRSHLRWRAAVEALRAEPGLTLIEADRSWGTWRFEGLLDPRARDPLVVLASFGVDAEDVEAHWEGYLSFDPEMVLTRSREALVPPEGVVLTLEGDRLHASGRASARWATEAEEKARGLPGIAVLDVSDLEREVPLELTSQADELMAERLLFDVGSARLRADSLARLDAVASRIRALNEEANAVRYALQIRLIGRTDESGTEEGNRTLSEERTRSVLAALADRGLDPDLVSVIGIGVSDPLEAMDEDLIDQVNRSVSFEVRFTQSSGAGETEN